MNRIIAMKVFKSSARAGTLSLGLLALACTTDSGPAVDSAGAFQASLIAPTDISQGYTSVLGKVYDGPSPSAVAWKQAAASGDCKLYTPDVPFCDPGCGSTALCVENNVCKDFPKSLSVGKVTVNGMKTKDGKTSFSMDPLLNSYQPSGGVIVDFPPFAEGATVNLSAAGGSGVEAFTVSAKGISPLQVLGDSLVLADGKSLEVKWTAPGDPSLSKVHAMVDISHHGGTKGKIECEGADDGSLEIAAALVDQLKALGVSGYPKIDVTRKSMGTNPEVKVDFILESKVTKSLSIPGLISCSGDEECPNGQTCQADMQCK